MVDVQVGGSQLIGEGAKEATAGGAVGGQVETLGVTGNIDLPGIRSGTNGAGSRRENWCGDNRRDRIYESQ